MVAASAQHSSRYARVIRAGSGLRNLIAALGLCLSLPALAQNAPVSIQRGTPQMAGQSSRTVALDKSPGQIREVVFQSTAATLIASDTNGVSDIFVKTDNPTDPHILVSQNLTVPGNGASTEPDATPDGALVVFTTQATNLLPGDANAVADIVLRDLATPSDPPERISVAHDGAQANGPSGRAAISANGLVVAFVSSASNLVPGDTNNGSDVFVRDRNFGSTTRVSLRSDGTEAADSGTAVRVDVSADGRFVVFSSAAANLVPGDANGASDIFVHDRFFGTTQRVSLNTIDGDPDGASLNPVISADGRFVAFESGASNLVFSDTNGVSDVFVRVLPAARTERVSVSSSGVQSNGASAEPGISADGRFIAFASTATNLGEGADTNGRKDVFLRDRISGSTRSRVQGNGDSSEPSVSGDGRTYAFTTAATDLGISDGNGTSDVWRALGRPDVSGSLGAATPPVPRAASHFTVEASVAAAGGFGPTPRGAVEIRAILSGSVAARCTSRELEPSGTGRCELSVDLPGAYVLELGFLGDPDYAAVPLLATAGLTVGAPAPTDLRIAVQAPEPSLANRSVFVQADLLPRGGRPGGIINFSSPAGSCIAELPLSGCLLPFGASDGLINATYSGDGTFAGDAASPLNHTVGTSIWRRVLETNQGSGRGPGGNAGPGPGALSADGRWFVFSTDQPHLVPEDRGDQEDVFLLDQRLGLIRRISKAANGDAANSDSVQPTISGDGRWVAFTTYASNVLLGDSNDRGDVVIVDVQNDTPAELVSTSSSGGFSGDSAFQPRLNHDGSLVAFHSRAADLVIGDSNSQTDVFVRDRRTNTTTRVSVGNGGSQGNGGFVGALTLDLSPDGRYLLFQSDFTNLVPGDSNGQIDVFRHDRQTSQTLRASIATDGSQSGDSAAEGSLSSDGDFAVFNTRASLVSEDVNGLNDVYLHEFSTRSTRLLSRAPYGLISSGTGARSPVIGSLGVYFISDALEYGSGGHAQVVSVTADGFFQEIVSRDSGGVPGNADSRSVAVSQDGQWVSFATLANLDPNAPLGGYMLVPPKGVPRAVQRAPVGRQPNGPSFGTTLSTSGRHAVIVSAANNLGPEDKNSFEDVYWLDLDTGDVRLLSKDPLQPDAANAASLGRTGISADGQRVAFTSSASNLVVGDSNAARDVFLANVGNGTLQRVSLSTSGSQAQSDSELVSLSTDGMKLLFRSADAALGTGAARAPIGSPPQLYLRDIADASTKLLSVNVGGTGAINAEVLAADGPDDSGCRVIYISAATDVVTGVSDGRRHLYLRDHCQSTTTVLDAVGATIGNGDVSEAVLARGGRFVAFESAAGNLVDGVTGPQLYLRNLDTNKITLIGVDQSGFPLGAGLRGGLSIDDSGRYVAFTVGIAKSTRGPGSREVLIRDTLAGQTATASDAAFFAGEPALSGDGALIAFTSNDDSLAVGDRNGLDDVLVRANPLLGEVYLVGDVSVSEGNTGLTSVNVDVTLSGGSSFPVTVDVSSVDGTATAPADYQAYNAPLVFSSDGTQTITVNVVTDTTTEPDETFTIRVQSQGGSPVTLATGTVTIQNDDTGPNVCTRQGAGSWLDGTRWSCAPISGGVPGPADTAIFDTVDDAATLTEPVVVATLDLRAGLIDGPNALTVSSQFLWSGGTLEAPDTFIPITLPAGSTSTLNGGAKTLRRRQLVNQGTLTWTAGTLTLAGTDTELRNEASVIIDVAPGNLRLASDGASGQFFHNTFNGGTSVTKRGLGRYEMDDRIEFRNGNSVRIELGMASFTGPGSGDPGPYQVDNGAIEFNLRAGQTRSIDGAVTGGGSLLKLGLGDVLLQGSFGAQGASVQDGRLLFQQSGTVALTHLLVGGNGTLSGAANLQAQRLTWTGGTISGLAGTTLRLLGSGANESALLGVGKCLDERQLILAGEARWTAGKLCLRTSARVEVASGGVLEVEPSAMESLENNDSSAVQLLVQGVFRKQGAVLDSNVPTIVNGSLVIAGGSLTQRATLTGTGLASIAAGARVQFAPTGSIDAALPFTGNGEIVTLAGTTRLLRPITGNTLRLGVEGGTARVESPLALRALAVTGGSLQVLQTVSSAAASSYSGGTIQIFGGTLDFSAALTINVAGADRLISCESGCSGSALRLLAGADVGINGGFKAALTGGLPLILDDPAARLAIGAGAGLELSGADQLRRGTLVVDGMLSRATGALGLGTNIELTVAGTGVLRAAAGITLNALVQPGGTGSIGQLTLDGPTTITGGSLRMDLASAASFDRLVMAGASTLALNPAAQLQPGGPYTPASSDVFPLIQHASGARSGTLTLTGGATGFVLEYPATRVEYRQPTGPRVCRFAVTSGVWDSESHWTCTPTGGFPGAADTAIVDNGGDVDQAGPRTVTGLQLVSGSIGSNSDPLIVTGSFSWTGGQFLGSSSTSDFVRVESTATSVTLGGVQKTLTERELRFDTDATWTTGLIELGDNGQLLIFPGRTLTTTPNATPPEFIFGSGAGAGVNNQGRILKTGAGKSGIESSVLYEGAGTLEVAAGGGEFFLHAPSSSIAGESKVATGGRLVFANSDQNFTSAARFIGDGELQFGRPSTPVQTDGSISLHRAPASAFTLSPTATVVIFDANLRIEAPGGVAFNRLTLDHPLAHLSGDAALSVTQTLLWRSGRISGSGPGLGVGLPSGAIATLSSPATRDLAARTLDVAGTLAIEGGTLALDATAQLQIQPGALLRFSGTGPTTLSSAAGPGVFAVQNNGRIERQVGSTTRLLAGLQQDGEVAVNAGATLEVGEFATGSASRFVVNGTLRNAAGLLAFGGGSVEGTGTLQATVVDNIAAEFRPGGVAAGTLTVNGDYRQQSDARLSLDLLVTGCISADRLVATGSATLAGALTLTPGGGCTPTPPQEFLLLDAATLTGTFGTVNGTPTNYIVDYATATGDVRLRVERRVTTTQITSVSPQPTPVGQPYTVTVSVGPITGAPPTGTVLVSATPFTESCTITLPATTCTMPVVTQPGTRRLTASYSGDALNLPSNANTTHPVQSTPTLTALGQTPTSTVVGQPFTVRARIVNPLSTLTPSGELQVRPLPLGDPVRCTLVETVPGTAEATCAGVISPIAAAKLIDIRYLGSGDQVFGTTSTSSVQDVTPAGTTLSFDSSPNPSAPGGSVQVDFTLAAALPSESPLSAITGLLSVTDGINSCTATLPATRCALTLTTVGVRQLRARYQGDANFNPSPEVVREHLVAAGGAELIVRKRNLQRTLIGGAATVYVVEVENRGPLAVTARVRDPIPTGLSNFRWTCSGENGAQCAASGTGALDENVLMPVGSLARFVLTADAQRDPEVTVVQEARVDPPTGIDDPNPANNVARDVDPIGLFGDGFEAEEQE